MRKAAAFAMAMTAALLITGCTFHHVEHPGGSRDDFVEFEPEPRHWGEHYHYEDVYGR